MTLVEGRLSPDEILERVQRVLGDKVTASRMNFGQADVTCRPENLVDVVTTLRDHEDTRSIFFTFLLPSTGPRSVTRRRRAAASSSFWSISIRRSSSST